jgi:hypothetical protein
MTHKITQDVKRERSLLVAIFFYIYTKFSLQNAFPSFLEGKKEKTKKNFAVE